MSLHWLWSTTPPALVQLSAALASIAQFLKLVPQSTKATDNRRILFIHVLIEMVRCHNEQMLAGNVICAKQQNLVAIIQFRLVPTNVCSGTFVYGNAGRRFPR